MKNFKNLLIAIFAVIFLYMLVKFPVEMMDSAKIAAEKWVNYVLPAMLPFFVASDILSQSGMISIISSVLTPITRLLTGRSGNYAYALICGAVSGYPVGAKAAASMYENHQISAEEASDIIRMTSVTGPVFILGSVGSGMLGNESIAMYILIPHYISVLMPAFFMRSKIKAKKTADAINDYLLFSPIENKTIGSILSKAVSSSVISILIIGGYIILFSVITSMVQILLPEKAAGICACILEMTNGCIFAAESLCLDLAIPTISAIISFSGFSIIAQTLSIASDAGIKVKGFVIIKSFQAIIAFVTSSIMMMLFDPVLPVFNYANARKAAVYIIPCGLVLLAMSLVMLYLTQKIVNPRQRYTEKN